MFRFSTTTPSTAVGEEPGRLQNPTQSWEIDKVLYNKIHEESKTNLSSRELEEDINTAVLSPPMPQTSPISIIMTASSSPIVDIRSKHEEPRYYAYVLVLSILLLSLGLVSGLIFYCIQRRKKLDALRHRLIPVYNFAPGEDDEWGVLLENPELGSNNAR